MWTQSRLMSKANSSVLLSARLSRKRCPAARQRVAREGTVKDHYNVLFLCTGNSARSIMAEAILNHKGAPRFTAYSAGSHPSGRVHPGALTQLQNARLSTDGFRSKRWEEFS